MNAAACPLCSTPGGQVVVETPRWRIVRAEEPGFPAFYRVIWTAHVREFSHLTAAERAECMEACVSVEEAILAHLNPTKVNLATLGNVVPHLHWHVIARFDADTHFPGPVWAAPQRAVDPAWAARAEAGALTVDHALKHRWSAASANRTPL